MSEQSFKYSPNDTVKLEDLVNETAMSQEDFEQLTALYDGSISSVQEGEVISGTISSITPNYVLVDVGFKSEGIIERSEFDGMQDFELGKEIEVFVDSVENTEGQLQLSYKKALFMATWKRLIGKHENNEVVQGTCQRRIKGGMVVNLEGIDAFLPGSQIDVKPIRNFDAYIGRELDLRIVKVNHARKNIVVSSRALIEESLSEKRDEILSNIEIGQAKMGVVKNITDFGVFIDLGGVDGLLHITDLSWGRVNHPSEIVELDQELEVKILDYDPEKKRISLGLKQLQEHPWENVEEKFPINSTVSGKVVSIADYGAFIELGQGIEGLIHISEMSWSSHVKHPSQVLKVGDEVTTKVLNIEEDSKKISLGLKQLEPDPWEGLEDRFPISSHHKGKVRNLTAFGVFIELEEGIDGLVHISDLSWTKKLKHPGEVVKKGEELEVVVLSIDHEERRIALGHKQLSDNPWDTFEAQYSIDSEITAEVSKVVEKGVVVKVSELLEGFVPNTHLAEIKKGIKVNVGDELKLVILEIDKEEKKLILSSVAFKKRQEAANVKQYRGKSSGTTIGDILKAQEDQADESNEE
jgi:small subunit ribosomal protein S1